MSSCFDAAKEVLTKAAVVTTLFVDKVVKRQSQSCTMIHEHHMLISTKCYCKKKKTKGKEKGQTHTGA